MSPDMREGGDNDGRYDERIETDAIRVNVFDNIM